MKYIFTLLLSTIFILTNFLSSEEIHEDCSNNNVPQSEFEEIVREAVSFEKEFVKDALPVDLIGMNSDLMCQYIEAVADRIADLFEFERIFNTENPFDFMRALDVQNVTNFFEKRVSEYQRPTDRALSFDEAF